MMEGMSETTQDIKAEQEMLALLEEPTAGLLNRHLSTAKEWFPHEMTPWSDGQDFTDEEIRAGRESMGISDGDEAAVKSALYVNLLTEDNLPYYTEVIAGLSDPDHPWMVWTRRWTAEEGRHSIAIRNYVETRRLLNPWTLERARMNQVEGGLVPHPASMADGLVYTSLQEQATQIAHRNTGRLLDEVGKKIMAMVAGDETRHYRFYHDLATEAFERKPSEMVLAAARQIIGFEMPGTGIPDFKKHEKVIREAGIYDLGHFVFQIVKPNLESWNFEQLEGLTPEAEEAREKVMKRVIRMGKAAEFLRERLQEKAAKVEA
jgi:acyl-[acyl-carrier-protein] desaturase